MSRIHAFRPEGKTVKVAATTTSGATPVQIHPGTSNHIRVWNSGTAEVYVAFGTSAVVAAVPAGSAQWGTPVPAGAVEIFTEVSGGYMAAIMAVGTASVFATPGEGL
jgi:hypothetical protein